MMDAVKLLESFKRGEFTLVLNQTEINKWEELDELIIKQVRGACFIGISDYKNAKLMYQDALSINPLCLESNLNLGICFLEEDNLDIALLCFQKCLEIDSMHYQALLNTANVLFQKKCFDKCKDIYFKLLKINPEDLEIIINLAIVFKSQKNYKDARDYLYKAQMINNKEIRIYRNLGLILQEKKKYKDAINFYEDASKIIKFDVNIMNDYGFSLLKVNNFEKARTILEKSYEINKDHVETNKNLMSLEFIEGRFKKAELYALNALRNSRNDFDLLMDLASIYFKIDNLKGSLHFLNKALIIKPESPNAICLKVKILSVTCDWVKLKNLQKNFHVFESAEEIFDVFSIMMQEPSAEKQFKYAISAGQNLDHIKKFNFRDRQSFENEKINIAYFSSDFHSHATMLLIKKHLKLHNRKKFNIFYFAYGKIDKHFFKINYGTLGDKLIDISNMSDESVSELARSLKIDVALDLKGQTFGSRLALFAYGVAPIQISFLGFPGTLGVKFMDFILTDEVIVPKKHQQFYSEKVLYLPNCYQPNDNSKSIKDYGYNKKDFGLEMFSFVFGNFNQTYKFNYNDFCSWMQIMRQVPDSCLWLLNTNNEAKTNIIGTAQSFNISPERIVFTEPLPHDQHISRLKLMDLFLDNSICNAHTTASDALWAEVPLVTIKGSSFASRVAASLLTSMHLEEMIVQDLADYEKLAVKLATDQKVFDKIKSKLRSNKNICPLFDTEKYTRGFEETILTLVNRKA
jgi:protein O-GlcNAc transferase